MRMPSRPGPVRHVHVCMKQPCNYCLARSNAVVPSVIAGDRCADFIDAVVAELRRRSAARRLARRHRRPH